MPEAGTQSRVENSSSFPQKTLSGCHFSNPLTPPVAAPLKARSVPSRPLVRGDPAHINHYNNRPYQVQGIVPWTGRPPVLRGPQPTCVIPTIEPDGTVIPREQRVSPGLGLYETPKVYVDAKLQPLKDNDAFNTSGAGMRRRSHNAGQAAAAVPATEPHPRMQWFHYLIHFTPIDNSPGVSESDEDGEGSSGDGDDYDDDESAFASEVTTVATPRPAVLVPVVAVPMAVRLSRNNGDGEGSEQSNGSRAPRPHDAGGPRLHRNHLPPTVPSSHRAPTEQAMYGYHGEPRTASDRSSSQQQLQLSGQVMSTSSLRKAEVQPPSPGPDRRSYSWGSGGSL